METINDIISATYFPKAGISHRDNEILKHKLGILARLYFTDSNRERWNICAFNGSICNLEMSLRSILFDVKKRSDINIDIKEEAILFMSNKHILTIK